jgi:O-antigen/teichoic acid export membrane protein
MSKYYKEDIRQFKKVCAFGLKYMLLLVLPTVIGTLFFADDIICIYGKAFINSASSLRFLMVSSFFTFLNIILVNAVIAVGRQKIDAIISGISVFLNIGLNLIFIPLFSYRGASITVIITEAFGFVAFLVALCKITGVSFADIKIPHIAIVNILLCLFFWVTKFLPFILILIISLILYIFLAFVFNIIRKDAGYLFGLYKLGSNRAHL